MKNVVLLTSMLCLSFIGFAQSESSKPDRKISFGFNLGTNYSNLYAKETLPDYASISNGVGASLGVFMDYSISKHLLFSPKIELAYNNCSVESDDETEDYNIFPISLDIMAHMKYKIGDGKLTPYILAGPNLKLPLFNKPKNSSDFETDPDFAIDFGIGFEKLNQYFILAPELRYSIGLLNVNQNPFLQSLNFNKISLILNFK